MIKDIELLQKKRQEEIEIYNIYNRIRKLCIYNSRQIVDILVKLFTEFEGVLYHYVRLNSFYLVEPYDSNIRQLGVYSNYKLNILNINDNLLNNKVLFSILSPSNFNYKKEKNEYVQYFFDFLYEKRSSSLSYEITNEELENLLQEFLILSRKLQLRRKEEIKKNIELRLKCLEVLEFKKFCLVDRNLIYKSLIYIINNYEENMDAFQVCEESWNRTCRWSKLYLYHNLIIRNGDKEICFKSLVDYKECYPDEEDCGLYMDANKDTTICFLI